MITLEVATLVHEEEICSFLKKYFTDKKDKCRWKALFDHKWAKDEPYGYVLIDENNKKIVGFIGTIFANRYIDGKKILTCSLSTWAVSEESRGKGLSMVSKLVKRKNILFLDFSANDASRKIFEFYKFQQLEKEEWTFFSKPIWYKNKPIYRYEAQIPLNMLNKNDVQVLRDNNRKCVKYVFIDYGEKGCLFVVFKKIKRKKLIFLEMLYLSNYNMSKSNIIKSLKALSFNNFTFGVIIDSRFIGETKDFHFTKNIKHKIYKNNTEYDIDLSKIDLLYSEKILLCQ